MLEDLNTTEEVKQPSIFLFMIEFVRSWVERIQSWSFRRNYEPARLGDGHAVLVIPGIIAHDFQMEPLRRMLDRLGYRTYAWEMGFNLADLEEIDILEKKIVKLHQDTGQKVSVIGWSLGGIYARDLARRHPDKIRQIFTLGSPFRGITKPTRASWVVHALKGNLEELIDLEWIKALENPTQVLTTSIYSKSDGVLPWSYCFDSVEDESHRNLEVVSSHLGFPHNREVLKIIADYLPDGNDLNKKN